MIRIESDSTKKDGSILEHQKLRLNWFERRLLWVLLVILLIVFAAIMTDSIGSHVHCDGPRWSDAT